MKVLLMLLLPCLSYAQDADSLKKYSYRIFGIEFMEKDGSRQAVGIYNGSCFFIRNQGMLFLITAKHVLSGCEDSTKKKSHPDQMKVSISKNGKEEKLYLDISKIKDTSSCLAIFRSADIIAVPIYDSIANQVYSVEHLIDNPSEWFSNVLLIGYDPPKLGIGQAQANINEPVVYNLPTKIHRIAYPFRYDTTTKGKDFINFYIVSKKGLIRSDFGGFSGSPVYLFETPVNKWRLAGVFGGHVEFFGSQYDHKWYVDIKYASMCINQFFKSKESK